MRQILVDGYNVIRADQRLQALERISLEHARDVLVRTLASSPRLSNDHVLVIFDGAHGSRSHIHQHRVGRIDTVYSARGQTADDVIVQQAASLAAGRNVVVVSNDVELRERCRVYGCEVSGSENLLQQLPGAMRARRPEPEEFDGSPTLSTVKRGNPRRSSRKDRRKREITF